MKKLLIKDLNSKGQGVGRIDGKVAFVDLALPNEEVEVNVLQEKKQYIHAETSSVLKTSEERVAAPCEYYPKCGGCQLQHASYGLQLKAKEQRVQSALKKMVDSQIKVLPIIRSPKMWEYRHKISMPLKKTTEGFITGLYQRNSHDLVPIEHCMLHNPTGERILKSVRKWLQKLLNYDLRHIMIRTSSSGSQVSLLLIGRDKLCLNFKKLAEEFFAKESEISSITYMQNTRNDNVILDKNLVVLAGDSYIQDQFMGFNIRLSVDAFFQVNTQCAELLYQKAIEFGDLSQNDVVLDAYCGVGMIGLLASQTAKKVVGVECVGSALEDAKIHAQKIPNIQFHVGRAEEVVPKLNESFTTCFLNPPRKGCDISLLQAVRGVPKIVYISCHPESLARDIAALQKLGYDLKKVQPVDMFPQTSHAETVALLRFKKEC